jgi:hypothetical protein
MEASSVLRLDRLQEMDQLPTPSGSIAVSVARAEGGLLACTAMVLAASEINRAGLLRANGPC